jgi:hypothetical protein
VCYAAAFADGPCALVTPTRVVARRHHEPQTHSIGLSLCVSSTPFCFRVGCRGEPAARLLTGAAGHWAGFPFNMLFDLVNSCRLAAAHETQPAKLMAFDGGWASPRRVCVVICVRLVGPLVANYSQVGGVVPEAGVEPAQP